MIKLKLHYKYKNKNKNMKNNDILKELDNYLIFLEDESNIVFTYTTIVKKPKKRSKFVSSTIFLTKYVITSSLIFAVLMISTNYSAYYNIAKSYIMKEQVEETKQWLISSVEAAKITSVVVEKLEEDKQEEQLSISKYKKELDSNEINLDINITTLDNRVIIPKTWKNIPLLDIENRSISWQSELNDIFMKELENWVIRYPGSAKPWEDGLSFIFWHSSNFPWLQWDYNDVFATLDRVMTWDEVIIYYNQKKYTFVIRERAIIKPGDVWILKRNKDKPEVAIMTCRPIWTTLNRFVIIWELVE